jgi:DNA-binding XRE family transcriptional regulator
MEAKSNSNSRKTEYIDISTRFKEIRIANKLTQKEMGKIVGLSAPSIGAIENGLYTPNFSVMRILKKKFKIDYSYLIDGDKQADIKNLRQENAKLKEELARLTKVVDKLVK